MRAKIFAAACACALAYVVAAVAFATASESRSSHGEGERPRPMVIRLSMPVPAGEEPGHASFSATLGKTRWYFAAAWTGGGGRLGVLVVRDS